MRIVYLADSQIPSRAANGMQVMRMCGAFAAAGADVMLVHPHHFGNRPEGFHGDIWAFYGVGPRFRLVTLPTPLTLGLLRVRWLARGLRAPPVAVFLLLRGRPGRRPFVAYGRSLLGISLAQGARKIWRRGACRLVVGEVHDLPRSARAMRTLSKLDGAVTISAELERDLLRMCPRLRGRTCVEHDGFDANALSGATLDRELARQILGIESGPPLVVYTGRVNTGKGARMLVEAAPELPEARFLLVGKVYERDLVDLGRHAGNVTFTGFVAPAAVGPYLAAADVLALPTDPTLSYARYTSPLKLFEYLAAGRPVVCSDLPGIREVVSDGRNALLFRGGDIESFVRAVRRLLDDPALAGRLAVQGRDDVEFYSWTSRAERILAWIGGIAPA